MLMMGYVFFMPNQVEHTLEMVMGNTFITSVPLILSLMQSFCDHWKMEILLLLHLVIKPFTRFRSVAVKALPSLKIKEK